MKMNYEDIPNLSNPDAYTRLLLDVMRGKQGSFVRDDELRRSWELCVLQGRGRNFGMA